MISVQVDDRIFKVHPGTNLLRACLENGLYIPNLCYLEQLDEPPASCRLCFVEIDGIDGPVAACSIGITSPLVVQTATNRVRRLQRANLKLLLSVHHVDCRNCPANRNCELQRLAKFLKTGLNAKPLESMVDHLQLKPDENHPLMDYHPYRCVLCGRCVAVCHGRGGSAVLTFAKRGFDTIISSYGLEHLEETSCEPCGACVEICPVGALTLKNS